MAIGFVINISNKINSSGYNLKEIKKLIDKYPSLDQEIFKLILWVSKYYHAPIGQILGLATPLYLRQGKIIDEFSYVNKKNENLFDRKKKELSKEQQDAVKNIKKSLSFMNAFSLTELQVVEKLRFTNIFKMRFIKKVCKH